MKVKVSVQFNSGLEWSEERISELEDRKELTQSKQQRENTLKKT